MSRKKNGNFFWEKTVNFKTVNFFFLGKENKNLEKIGEAGNSTNMMEYGAKITFSEKYREKN